MGYAEGETCPIADDFQAKNDAVIFSHFYATIFTLLEQKILLITGFTHIRLETLGSVKFSAVNQQTPKEGEVCSEKFTGELIPNVPTVVAYHC